MINVVGGKMLIGGQVSAPVLRLEEAISFWGGVDCQSGQIIDKNHPQCGANIAGKILILPGTRGSTASPGALLEALVAGVGPRGFVLTAADNVCLVAASMCSLLGQVSPPLLDMTGLDLSAFHTGCWAQLSELGLSKVNDAS